MDELTRTSAQHSELAKQSPQKLRESLKSLSKAKHEISATQSKYQVALEAGQHSERQLRKYRRELEEVLSDNQILISSETKLKQELSLLSIEARKQEHCFAEKDSEIQSLSQEVTRLQHVNHSLEQQTNEFHSSLTEIQYSGHRSEQLFREQMEKALVDLAQVADERDALKQTANETIAKCADTVMAQQSTDRDNKKLQRQVETLIASKGLLQQTMSEQLSSVKNQVEDFRNDLERCETENFQLREQNEELKVILSESRHKSFKPKWEWLSLTEMNHNANQLTTNVMSTVLRYF